MQYRNRPAVSRITLGALVIWMASAGSLQADLYQSCIRSVEWLVDNSDVIVVTREAQNGGDARPAVLRTLKGDAARIKWPLKKPRVGGYTYYEPPSDGPVRLIFVRGTSELLGSVKLARQQPDVAKIHDVLYGVTQYGRLLLTPPDLFDAIDAQLRAGPGQPVARKKDSPHYERSGIEAPKTFPLEGSDDTYVLIVPFTTARRDHYINLLRSGDASERLDAIHELAQLIDEKARQAIREAATCKNVEPAYAFKGNSIHVLTAADVRIGAKAALEAKGGLSRGFQEPAK